MEMGAGGMETELESEALQSGTDTCSCESFRQVIRTHCVSVS